MSEKRLIATGVVVRCSLCEGTGKLVVIETCAREVEEKMCLGCLGKGNIVYFEAYEKARA